MVRYWGYWIGNTEYWLLDTGHSIRVSTYGPTLVEHRSIADGGGQDGVPVERHREHRCERPFCAPDGIVEGFPDVPSAIGTYFHNCVRSSSGLVSRNSILSFVLWVSKVWVVMTLSQDFHSAFFNHKLAGRKLFTTCAGCGCCITKIELTYVLFIFILELLELFWFYFRLGKYF